MKIVVYDVVFNVEDTISGDASQSRVDVVAPDMPLDEAIRYMNVWAINNWKYSFIHVEVIHIDKKYALGWT